MVEHHSSWQVFPGITFLTLGISRNLRYSRKLYLWNDYRQANVGDGCRETVGIRQPSAPSQRAGSPCSHLLANDEDDRPTRGTPILFNTIVLSNIITPRFYTVRSVLGIHVPQEAHFHETGRLLENLRQTWHGRRLSEKVSPGAVSCPPGSAKFVRTPRLINICRVIGHSWGLRYLPI